MEREVLMRQEDQMAYTLEHIELKRGVWMGKGHICTFNEASI
jgi:hypothetical protein